MPFRSLPALPAGRVTALTALLLTACAGGSPDAAAPPMKPAQGASLQACAELAARLSLPGTTITSAAPVAADTLKVGGVPAGEHCLVVGRTGERKSAVDGQTYAIGWQMRLPAKWNGRFYHQGNGGLDGIVANATGPVGGGGELTSALQQGFAVLSSDAGHSAAQNPLFGVDPQARLDYGYQAVQALTPMAKALVAAAYGRGPDRAYFAGTSNGGRHTMVAAVRLPAEYDGFLATSPGFNLPKAAVAQLWGAQQWNTVATSTGTAPNFDLESAFTQTERRLVANAILAKCDALDGLADGLVQDVTACRGAFDLARDVPTCTAGAARDGSCLSADQKTVLARVFAGGSDAQGRKLYRHHYGDPDHEALARFLTAQAYPWLVSYDDHPRIRELYASSKMQPIYLDYKVKSSRTAQELVISNLVIPPPVYTAPLPTSQLLESLSE